jgi:glutathione S-transferase
MPRCGAAVAAGPVGGRICRYAPEKIPYAVERYTKEAKRLLGVLEARLKEVGGPYIMGQDYTIAGAVLTHQLDSQRIEPSCHKMLLGIL